MVFGSFWSGPGNTTASSSEPEIEKYGMSQPSLLSMASSKRVSMLEPKRYAGMIPPDWAPTAANT